jgi:diguanylate cyclase (GGDEF)-like protein
MHTNNLQYGGTRISARRKNRARGMVLDYNSLLIALAFSAACLTATLFGSWLYARTERFLLTWAYGALFIVLNIAIYSFYIKSPGRVLGAATFTTLAIGFSLLLAAARQFRTGGPVLWRFVVSTALTCAIVLPAMLAGYDGLAFMIYNTVASVLLFATAADYWKGRAEAPAPITALTVLYSAVAVSFLLCAIVLIADGRMVLGRAPDNWAEDLSLAIAIAGMTGIGALSLALNQWRLAGKHHAEARTDALTGLLNRRALFDLHGAREFTPFEAVVLFDLDRFKAVNDTYGHAVGDEVIVRFAEIIKANLRSTDAAARLGGEEFAVVLLRTMPDRASIFAERVRAAFAAEPIETSNGPLRCTVSAGVAFGIMGGTSFEAVLREADHALYAAKESGRDRIALPGLKRVV